MSIPILTYHQIDIVPPHGTPLRGLTVSPAQFRQQIAWMRRLGYRGLSMRELMPYIRGKATGKVFGITFDDGFRNVHRYALPVLAEFGFSATNYFVSGQIGGSNVWDASHGVLPAPLMNGEEVREWARLGNEVGAHTVDHVHLPALPPAEARRQIEASKAALEDLVAMPVTAFCYPYGEQQSAHREMVREAGYDNATLTQRGLARADDNAFGLPRVNVHCGTNLLRFLQKCLTRHEDKRRGY
ncbi:polysaccharide deacetylase family protein [Cupriavidus sp. IDO]|uniref:polysaccharide deacetylase family protein n=1 Tax=Cupriavidus sp. IDO TaxID=1539142 RepID=UPI00057972B5|nr:polysaccharide deacetylase family protein [Cupriavidus sp. IDO]KWR91143.1 polysaccharide deacetylase [Cupriavidus sp. IDO]